MQLIEEFDAKGKRLSPKLAEGIKNYLIDIDGTICEDIPNEEPERMLTAPELPGAKGIILKWYDEGHIITFFTSRTEAHRANTEKWLALHGYKYHGIIFGKPRGGNYHLIDDRTVRATRFNGKFTPFVKVSKEILIFEE
ncbi:MAG: phosphoheptose isomerase [Bacteroidetes bacterium RIFCSPHIGHO2_02_FULL_44_7]|uniref:Phosphoheptose isomerase n=1 Tax=Candidatus Nomurabacteria bacterium RIFCSPHIGHO2_01_FULL_40_20 TaxID=1801738 RepID=A0A1F6V1I9_9BACT|nr:MAG: phosphoheptose isomerase [Bacteroidetes bacterium RIFCSPHIGHO2_02_FULL_44_7]OGI63631.1 MAG: phosphoheptose isomerase [Candidatus Nomurabacteria bacterium RIFCSPHIGHO2_01_FULL_40_20]